MITLITIVVILTCLIIICMILGYNKYHSNIIKKHTKEISSLNSKISNLSHEIWCIQHPPKYKIGDKVKFYDQSSMTYTIRDIIHDNSEMRWKYLLDNNQPKYAPRWYSEISIRERLY
jgi:hypothetical protein